MAVLNGSTATQLREAIAAAVEANPAWTSLAIAEHIIAAHQDLILAWALDPITRLVRMARGHAVDPLQTYFEGFRSLDARLPIEDGHVPLKAATLAQLRQSLEILRARHLDKPTKQMLAVEAAIKRMEPYTVREPRSYTYGEYVQAAAMGFKPIGKPRHRLQGKGKGKDDGRRRASR